MEVNKWIENMCTKDQTASLPEMKSLFRRVQYVDGLSMDIFRMDCQMEIDMLSGWNL